MAWPDSAIKVGDVNFIMSSHSKFYVKKFQILISDFQAEALYSQKENQAGRKTTISDVQIF